MNYKVFAMILLIACTQSMTWTFDCLAGRSCPKGYFCAQSGPCVPCNSLCYNGRQIHESEICKSLCPGFFEDNPQIKQEAEEIEKSNVLDAGKDCESLLTGVIVISILFSCSVLVNIAIGFALYRKYNPTKKEGKAYIGQPQNDNAAATLVGNRTV